MSSPGSGLFEGSLGECGAALLTPPATLGEAALGKGVEEAVVHVGGLKALGGRLRQMAREGVVIDHILHLWGAGPKWRKRPWNGSGE